MTSFDVLSINPKTKLLERMAYANREDAENQQQRAIDQGRLMVEITETAEEHLDWARRARKTLEELEGTTP